MNHTICPCCGKPKKPDFSGYRYGLQALKPAIETILIFQKPYEGKPIDNIIETGAGVLNIDGGRIGTEEITTHGGGGQTGTSLGWSGNDGRKEPSNRVAQNTKHVGRWPSNFLLLDPGAAAALDEQSGILQDAKGQYVRKTGEAQFLGVMGDGRVNDPDGYSDSGGASRFFFRVSEKIDEADPVYYSAKASRGEREAGLDGRTETELSHKYGSIRGDGHKFTAPDGTTHSSGVTTPSRNPHPTVKPLSLCEYLATLLLPPIEYAPRRLFVPFAGVASEMIGAIRAGWEEVEGVEITGEYIPIAQARLAYWQTRPKGYKKPKSSIPQNVKDPRQLELK